MNKNEKYINDYLFFQEGPGVRNYQYTTSGVKLLNVSNLVDGELDLSNSNRYISDEEANGKYKHFLCDVGDLIIASSGIKADYFDKKMGFVKEEMLPLCMNTSTIRFKPLNETEMNIKYFMYYLKSSHFRKQLEYNLTGSAQLNFGPSHLKKMKFIYHDISRQNKIVEKLDSISKMINTKKEQLSKLDELIKSQFVEMFVNKEYSKITVEDVCEKMKIGPFGSALHKNEISTSGDVFVLGTDNAVDNEFKVYEQRFITTEKFKELEKYKVAAGDIIISMMGTIGRTSVIPEDFYPSIISSHLCMLTSNSNKMDPYFLNCILILDDNISHQINMNKKGAIMSGLNLGIIKKLQIPNVPIEEQQKFLNIKNQIDKQKFEFENSLKKLEELQASLMQEYFG